MRSVWNFEFGLLTIETLHEESNPKMIRLWNGNVGNHNSQKPCLVAPDLTLELEKVFSRTDGTTISSLRVLSKTTSCLFVIADYI